MLLPIARIAGAAVALVAMAGCEYYPPPQDASSSSANASSGDPSLQASNTALQKELSDTEVKLAEARAEPHASGAAKAQPPAPAQPSAPRPTSTAAPLTPFVAGGEERIECPAGFLAEDSKDTGCACVSTEDGATVSPFQEPPCSSTARAEAGECIFTCPASSP